jgi:ribosomal protein S18 acetylase RimI-like enzyme
MEVRLATPADKAEVGYLIEQLDGVPPLPTQKTFVSLSDNRVVGVAVVSQSNDTAQISHIIVDKEYRNRGAGRALECCR